MNLVDFLGWEDSNGIYRSEVDGELYRVVNNILEVYDPDRLEWGNCDLPVNEYTTLQAVRQRGEWAEGFEICNAEDWQLVKTYYLQNGYGISDGVVFNSDGYIKNHVVFYAWLQYGKIQITTNKEWAKRDLILKSIDWHPKYYAKYAGKAKFYSEMYWQMDASHSEVSLVEKGNVVSWNSMSIFGTLRDWKRCGITTENAVFIPVGSDKRNINCLVF